MIDKLKLVLALLLVAVGIAGFYFLEDKALVLRILALMVGIVAALAVMWTSSIGKDALSFIGESINEAKRVVWPTRKETIQTTVAVFVMVVIMAAFLAVVDVGFAYMVQWIMGRSA
ncbi:MAG TPA: preprotein translocase subunit SecE [Methylophilaceae bacterium]|nr:preprotein translocase subunit SecE [Methylophilaceae bacterium]HAJ71202.1 preprotein translocase subunit SecE [Methylophilaceae bacterium]